MGWMKDFHHDAINAESEDEITEREHEAAMDALYDNYKTGERNTNDANSNSKIRATETRNA